MVPAALGRFQYVPRLPLWKLPKNATTTPPAAIGSPAMPLAPGPWPGRRLSHEQSPLRSRERHAVRARLLMHRLV